MSTTKSFGRILGSLGQNLGSIWDVLGVSWHPFWRSGGRLGTIFLPQGVLRSPLAAHRAIMLPLWPPKGLHSAPLGPPRPPFGVIFRLFLGCVFVILRLCFAIDFFTCFGGGF